MPSAVISIVIYRPDVALLARTLTTLGVALETARRTGAIDAARLELVDHSPEPLDAGQMETLKAALGPLAAVHYDVVGRNLGFGGGHNRAFGRCGDDELFLVANPDLEFEADSLRGAIEFFSRHPETGLLAPALRQDDGSLRPACFRYPDPVTLAGRFFAAGRAGARSARYEYRDWPAGQPMMNPETVSGCCMLFRAAAFARLGGFDPAYFLYFEDFDLSRRAGLAGLSAYCPAMRIRHHGGGVARKGWRHVRLFVTSALRFFSRHGWRPPGRRP